MRQPKSEDNRPNSTYDMYDDYLKDDEQPSTRQSGYGDLGMGFLNGDMDDEDDSDDETIACSPDAKYMMKVEDKPPSPALPEATISPSVQIVAPKPGYAAAVSALHDTLKSPEPSLSPVDRGRPEMQMPSPHMSSPISSSFNMPQPALASPRAAFFPPTVPSTPHPLPPSTPITPQFARPPKTEKSDVKFSEGGILRGTHEETLLPRRGEKGDDFWRRFSMVVKMEDTKKGQSSWWLKKTQSGKSRLSAGVWVTGVVILAIIGAAIGLGWYISHLHPSPPIIPEALGGSESEGATLVIASSTTKSSGGAALGEGSSTVKHVSPTNTVNDKRAEEIFPTPIIPEYVYHPVPTGVPSRHKRTTRRVIS